MDMTIYKISDDGTPADVFAVDVASPDGKAEPYGRFQGLAAFPNNV